MRAGEVSNFIRRKSTGVTKPHHSVIPGSAATKAFLRSSVACQFPSMRGLSLTCKRELVVPRKLLSSEKGVICFAYWSFGDEAKLPARVRDSHANEDEAIYATTRVKEDSMQGRQTPREGMDNGDHGEGSSRERSQPRAWDVLRTQDQQPLQRQGRLPEEAAESRRPWLKRATRLFNCFRLPEEAAESRRPHQPEGGDHAERSGWEPSQRQELDILRTLHDQQNPEIQRREGLHTHAPEPLRGGRRADGSYSYINEDLITAERYRAESSQRQHRQEASPRREANPAREREPWENIVQTGAWSSEEVQRSLTRLREEEPRTEEPRTSEWNKQAADLLLEYQEQLEKINDERAEKGEPPLDLVAHLDTISDALKPGGSIYEAVVMERSKSVPPQSQ
jgi:hypothetical protein